MNWVLTLLAGVAGWQLAARWKLPAPAMLGSMLAVGLTNILFDYAALPMAVKVFAQAISGAFIGMQIGRKDVARMRGLIVPFLLLAVMLTVNTFVVGIAIQKLCGWDWITALLSCVAGGVTDISLIAMEMDADVGTVAMMQTARLVGVLLFFPYWIQFVTRHEPKTAAVTEEKPLDAAHTPLDRLISTRSSRIVFTLLLSITAATFSSLSSTLVPVGLLLISYWTVNGLYSGICKRTKLLDLKSAMFASAPGGATDMSLIAADLGADLSQIALIQVLRAAYVVAVMPPLILGFIQWIG